MAKGAPNHTNGTVPIMTPKSATKAPSVGRPTIEDLHGDNHYAEVARKYWLKKTKATKVLPKVIKEELWHHLETDGFAYGSLLILETLQVLEK
jgi:intron-binding protein aquarius